MAEENLSRQTSEESDLLEHSTKKTKTSTESPMGEVSMSKEDGTSGAKPGALSFKQIVANESASETMSQTELDLISDDEEESGRRWLPSHYAYQR